MHAVVDQVGGSGHFEGNAVVGGMRDLLVEPLQQFVAGICNHTMFLQKPIDHRFEAGRLAQDPCKGHVFTRVVQPVGVVAKVIDDVLHQPEVRMTGEMEFPDFLLQYVQQARKLRVLFVPCKDCFRHVVSPEIRMRS